MPIRKQKIMVASRMKISMVRFPQSLFERRGFADVGGAVRVDTVMRRNRIGRGAKPDALDDEQEKANAADRNRQIGNADRQERESRKRVVPGHFDEAFAPHDHEERDQRHEELYQQVEKLANQRR